MMKPTLTFLGMLVLALPARAQVGYVPTAQVPYPNYGPRISPYSSIVTGGNNPAVNYYNLTLPQFRLRDMSNQLSTPMALNLPVATPEQDDLFPTLPVTGHVAGFQYFNPYYNAGSQRPFFPYNPAAAGQQQSFRQQR